MKTTFKDINTSCKILRLYGLMLTMFIINFIAFFSCIIFLDKEFGFLAGMFQLMLAPISSILIVSAFSMYYPFLMSAPYKIGNISNQMFSIYEISTTINFAFTGLFALAFGYKRIALFQLMDYFYILILGYVIINIMSNSELKISFKGKAVWSWLIDYFSAILLFIFQTVYTEEFSDSKVFLNISLGLIAAMFIASVILRKYLRGCSTKRIRAMQKIKYKKIKAS